MKCNNKTRFSEVDESAFLVNGRNISQFKKFLVVYRKVETFNQKKKKKIEKTKVGSLLITNSLFLLYSPLSHGKHTFALLNSFFACIIIFL